MWSSNRNTVVNVNNITTHQNATVRNAVIADPNLMRQIIAVHHPHLDAKLLDQVLIKFYWLREQSELRKKPSTSELIDWISALLLSGHRHTAQEGAG